MTLQKLKEWLEALPEEFDEFKVVYSEETSLNVTDQEGNEYYSRKDIPINAGLVDEETKEICLMKEIKSF